MDVSPETIQTESTGLGLSTSVKDVFKLTVLLSLPFDFFFFFSDSTQWGLYAGLFIGGIVGVILILEVVILLLRRRGTCLTIKRFVSDSAVNGEPLRTGKDLLAPFWLSAGNIFAITLNAHTWDLAQFSLIQYVLSLIRPWSWKED